jgi:hypothetical protein
MKTEPQIACAFFFNRRAVALSWYDHITMQTKDSGDRPPPATGAGSESSARKSHIPRNRIAGGCSFDGAKVSCLCHLSPP